MFNLTVIHFKKKRDLIHSIQNKAKNDRFLNAYKNTDSFEAKKSFLYFMLKIL